MNDNNGLSTLNWQVQPVVGRRSKINEEIIQEIINYIIEGSSYKDAANLAGINETTIYNWAKSGRKILAKLDVNHDLELTELEFLYLKFFYDLEKAIPKQKQELIKTIKKASEKNWTAAAWLLERKYNEEYGKKARVDHYSWREDAKKLGLDSDDLMEQLADTLAERINEQEENQIIDADYIDIE